MWYILLIWSLLHIWIYGALINLDVLRVLQENNIAVYVSGGVYRSDFGMYMWLEISFFSICRNVEFMTHSNFCITNCNVGIFSTYAWQVCHRITCAAVSTISLVCVHLRTNYLGSNYAHSTKFFRLIVT